MKTRKCFSTRKMTRTIPRPYPASSLYIQFYWCPDSDRAAFFFSDQEECLGEFSRQEIYENGWLS